VLNYKLLITIQGNSIKDLIFINL